NTRCTKSTPAPFQKNGSWDTVSTLPEDAADILAKCPCLPELEEYPWTEQELREVVRKVVSSDASFTGDAVHRLSVLLRRALVRISREAQRLSELHRRCTRLEVQSAVRLVLSWGLAEKCVSSAVKAVLPPYSSSSSCEAVSVHQWLRLMGYLLLNGADPTSF
uniref:ABTB2/3 histone-like domain-containing protein n=1 Tax=Stegastes partitus TaxID=144197 RepID=A0A3B4ZK46_9TELE